MWYVMATSTTMWWKQLNAWKKKGKKIDEKVVTIEENKKTKDEKKLK
jgi:hypothetical protein